MAMQAPLANDKKRVKVYELRDNDWFDRGTGFCTGQVINVRPISQAFVCAMLRVAMVENYHTETVTIG
jgi:protein phosphatase-4 regulatory subunit 3